jgi:hypothetical protein
VLLYPRAVMAGLGDGPAWRRQRRGDARRPGCDGPLEKALVAACRRQARLPPDGWLEALPATLPPQPRSLVHRRLRRLGIDWRARATRRGGRSPPGPAAVPPPSPGGATPATAAPPSRSARQQQARSRAGFIANPTRKGWQ